MIRIKKNIYWFIQYQIPNTNFERIVWHAVTRINIDIVGLEDFTITGTTSEISLKMKMQQFAEN